MHIGLRDTKRSIKKGIDNLNLAKSNKIILAAIVIQAIIILTRTINLEITGAITADETRYVLDGITGRIYDNVNRPIPGILNVLLFKLFRIGSIDGFLIFFPIYQMFLGSTIIITSYKIIELFEIKERAKNLTLISLLFMPTYALMSVAFLTEQLSLVFSIIGIYFAVKYIKKQDVISSIGLAVLFVCASLVREPYMMFPLFAPIIILIMFKAKRSHFIHLLLVMMITVPFIDLRLIGLSSIDLSSIFSFSLLPDITFIKCNCYTFQHDKNFHYINNYWVESDNIFINSIRIL